MRRRRGGTVEATKELSTLHAQANIRENTEYRIQNTGVRSQNFGWRIWGIRNPTPASRHTPRGRIQHFRIQEFTSRLEPFPIPHSEIRNSPPRVPLRPPREATGEDARLQCAPTVSQRRPTRRHADTPFPYLSAGTAIENTLPGPVNSANRRVRTVAALNSPRANPIQMPIAPAPRMNAKRYAAGMATPQ